MPRSMLAVAALPVAAAAAIIVSTAAAFALESNVTVKSSLPPEVVWQKVGDFCGIKTWIPAVADCVVSPDGKQRTVSLKGGGEVIERLDNWDELEAQLQLLDRVWSAAGLRLPLHAQCPPGRQRFGGELAQHVSSQGNV